MKSKSRGSVEPDGYWERSDDAVVRVVGDDIFLAAPSEGTIHALNPMASAVWRVLETPRTFQELCVLFETAFPDAGPRQMRDNLRDLLMTLEKDGLVSHVATKAQPC